jgi:hypothetical protein
MRDSSGTPRTFLHAACGRPQSPSFLPVDVRYLRLSSRGLCLADHVLSQLSPSPQSGASIPVCYLSCHVFAIANRHFSQPSSSPDPAAAPYSVVPPWELYLPFVGWPRIRGSRGECATSPAMSLLSLTVVSHSLTFDGAAVGAAFAVPGVASGSGVLGEWLLFGSGLVVGVCRFYMLYLVYLDCLPMLLSVPASCHCDRCFCHSPHTVCHGPTRTHLYHLTFGFTVYHSA